MKLPSLDGSASEWFDRLTKDWTLLERPASTWIIAAAAFVAVALGVPIIRAFIRRRAQRSTQLDRSVARLIGSLNDRWLRLTTIVIGLAVATFLLSPDPRVGRAAQILLVVMLGIQFARLVPTVIDWGIVRLTGEPEPGAPPSDTASTLVGLRWLILIAAYAVIFLLALQNLGVDVTAMIAGLGIGGIAIALAAQNVLGDLFASLTISLDKPFVVGDFIVVGTEMGTIEAIGLKTTRVRSLSGEQLVFSNSDLLGSRIRNFKRMEQRRVVFAFGVVYSTPPEQLEEIPSIVRRAVEAQPNARFDRCHFHRFGNSSLDFETVYHVGTRDFNPHMDVQQAVHLAIARAFLERGIEFAFPTQTIYLANEGDGGESAAAASVRSGPR